MTEPDNLVLGHLRELRADINAPFEGIEQRLDMMHANGVKALNSFVGHRTMTERSMASFDEEVTRLRKRVNADIADLKRRIEMLEAAQP